MTPRDRATYTVLVVDDDPSVLATYRRLLTRAGYATRTEGDPYRVLGGVAGKAAGKAAEGPADGGVDGVDLLLLDYKMPGMDGLTLLAELRRREFRAPCILVSAWLNDDVRLQAANLGVRHVLDKPVQAPVLRRAMDELLPLIHAGPAKAG